MFGYFYPENNRRFLESLEFETAADAIAWFRDKRTMWQQFEPQNAGDAAAFLNPLNGDIVVVRKVE